MLKFNKLTFNKRKIEILRKLFPGNWSYDPAMRRWIGETFSIQATSYDYDELRGIHTVRYVRTDNGRIVTELGFHTQKVD